MICACHVCTCCFLFSMQADSSIRHVMCQVVIKAQQIAVSYSSSYIPNVDVRTGATCASDTSTTNRFFLLLYTSRKRLSPSLPPASPCITPSSIPPRRCHPAAAISVTIVAQGTGWLAGHLQAWAAWTRRIVGISGGDLPLAKSSEQNFKANLDLVTLPHDVESSLRPTDKSTAANKVWAQAWQKLLEITGASLSWRERQLSRCLQPFWGLFHVVL